MLEDLKNGGTTCLLRKALYGLKQSGWQWYEKLNKVLKSFGLDPKVGEPCLYHTVINGKIIFVLIFVCVLKEH